MPDYFLGADASKGYADFLFMDKDKQPMEGVFQLDDTFEGHHHLYKILKNFFSCYPDATVHFGIESTGGLEDNWLNLFYRLKGEMNIKAARINPVGPTALHKASLERNGNDAISARYVAEYLVTHPKKVNYNVEDPYVGLRKQFNYIKMLTKQQTQLLNYLSILLYSAMPFLVSYCKYGVPNWMLALLSKYPSAAKLGRAAEVSLVTIPYISHNRALKIQASARQNVGSATDGGTAFVIQDIVGQIIRLKKTIELQKRHMEKNCDLPEVKLLGSIKGIGRYTAIGLILNIISIERFPTAKHLASYFGLHPVYKKSGDGSMGFHMSKKGRTAPRELLFMAAWTARVHCPLIKAVYIEHVKRGKTKMSAIGVCMHKMLRIVFGVLKNNKAFDPEVDKRNRARNKAIQGQGKQQGAHCKKRRYQPLDENAPVSGRQSKKRKEKQSQPAVSEVYGINVSPSIVVV